MHALCLFALAPTGFRHPEFRDHVAQLQSRDPATYPAGSMTYDLRRLRRPGRRSRRGPRPRPRAARRRPMTASPTTAGSAPKFLVHVSWLRTTTRTPGCSSAGEEGAAQGGFPTPSVWSNSHETICASQMHGQTTSGQGEVGACDKLAMCASVRVFRRKSKKFGYDRPSGD